MKKTTFIILTISYLSIGLISCGGDSKESKEILTENEKLKKELDDLKFGAEKLLANSKTYLENKDFIKAQSELQTLIDKHPNTSQSKEATELIVIAEKGATEQKIINEKARVEKEKAEKARIANATKKMRVKYDDIKRMTWYYDKSTPQYTNYNSLHLYIGKEKYGQPYLRFRIQYTADDWLFIESYVIKTDLNTYNIPTSYGEVETDNGSGDIWEWYDVNMDKKLYAITKDIVNSKTVKLRCNGKQYYKDRVISEKEKKGLQNVLDTYEALGGKPNF